jgi:hypothetical protein
MVQEVNDMKVQNLYNRLDGTSRQNGAGFLDTALPPCVMKWSQLDMPAGTRSPFHGH